MTIFVCSFKSGALIKWKCKKTGENSLHSFIESAFQRMHRLKSLLNLKPLTFLLSFITLFKNIWSYAIKTICVHLFYKVKGLWKQRNPMCKTTHSDQHSYKVLITYIKYFFSYVINKIFIAIFNEMKVTGHYRMNTGAQIQMLININVMVYDSISCFFMKQMSGKLINSTGSL